MGNVINTRDHLPGTLLLPALDARLRKLLGAQAPELTRLLAQGRVQVRNAYPVTHDQRLLPAPAALMEAKDNPGSFVNQLWLKAEDDHDIQRKQVRGGYVTVNGMLPLSEGTAADQEQAPTARARVERVETQSATHAVIEDASQRPTSNVGGVYTYAAIRAGTRFRCHIALPATLLDNADLDVLAGPLRLGRAKKDDYGLAEVNHVARIDQAAPAPADGNAFTLWLTAPLFARDARLRPITDSAALRDWLARALGDDSLRITQAFARSHREEGWNRAWAEARVTRFGLAAGSCFLITTDNPVDPVRLAHIARHGLGERRGEGYGEVQINAPLLHGMQPPLCPEPTATAAAKTAPAHPKVTGTDFAKQLEQRAARIVLRRTALSRANAFAEELKWGNDKPTNSQLGALRSLFEDWEGDASVKRLKAWRVSVNKRDNRRQSWQGTNTLDLLEALEGQPERIWDHLFPNASSGFETLVSDEKALKQRMTHEAIRTLWLSTIGRVFDQRAQQERSKAHGSTD